MWVRFREVACKVLLAGPGLLQELQLHRAPGAVHERAQTGHGIFLFQAHAVRCCVCTALSLRARCGSVGMPARAYDTPKLTGKGVAQLIRARDEHKHRLRSRWGSR